MIIRNQQEDSTKRLPLWIIPSVLGLLYLMQCAWFLRTQSLTYDEPAHIAEGLDAWRHGRFQQYNDHPPFARLWCALPLLSEKWQLEVQQLENGLHVSSVTPAPESLAWRARSMNVVLGLALAVLLWTSARCSLSAGAANLALALYVFSPTVIANFSVATTDGAATLMIFATAVQLMRWRERPSWAQTLLFSFVLGLMLLAKFSTPPMLALAIGWILILRPDAVIANPRQWNWSKAAVTLVVAAFVVWAGYFFHVSRLTIGDGILTATFPHWTEPIQKPVRTQINLSIPVPAGEYIEGLRTVARHNARGQASYFLGQVSPTGGWKLFYPVVMLLKWPAIVWLLFLGSMVHMLKGLIRAPANLLVMTSFPALYMAFAIFSHFSLGDRHVLPVYVFVLFFAGGLWEASRRWRAAAILLVLAVVLQAADSLRYAPDYLSYFNVWVRPEESYKLLSGSNLDWGQGLLAVRQYERAHPDEQIWLAYFGSVDPELYGVKARPLVEGERVTGTVIVGATNLSGEYLRDPASYRWLLQYRRAELLNHSLHAFKVGTN